MNEIVAKFLDESREIEKNEKYNLLNKLGLYDKKIADFETICKGTIIDGENKGTIVGFTWKNRKAEEDQKSIVRLNGKNENVQINSYSYKECLKKEENKEYSNMFYDKDLKLYRHYKKIPIEVSDEEYSEIIKTKKAQDIINDEKDKKSINNEAEIDFIKEDVEISGLASLLYGLAVIVFIIGIICGVCSGAVLSMFGIWFATLLSGIFIIAIGSVINHLNSIDVTLSKCILPGILKRNDK